VDRRQALKSIVLAPLCIYLLGGAVFPKTPELKWYQTPCEGRLHKIGLKAIWPNGEIYGYVALLFDVSERLPINKRNEVAFFPEDVHPAFAVVKDKLTRMALKKVVSTYPRESWSAPNPVLVVT